MCWKTLPQRAPPKPTGIPGPSLDPTPPDQRSTAPSRASSVGQRSKRPAASATAHLRDCHSQPRRDHPRCTPAPRDRPNEHPRRHVHTAGKSHDVTTPSKQAAKQATPPRRTLLSRRQTGKLTSPPTTPMTAWPLHLQRAGVPPALPAARVTRERHPPAQLKVGRRLQGQAQHRLPLSAQAQRRATRNPRHPAATQQRAPTRRKHQRKGIIGAPPTSANRLRRPQTGRLPGASKRTTPQPLPPSRIGWSEGRAANPDGEAAASSTEHETSWQDASWSPSRRTTPSTPYEQAKICSNGCVT